MRLRNLACRFGWVGVLGAAALAFFLPSPQRQTLSAVIWVLAGVAALASVAIALARRSDQS